MSSVFSCHEGDAFRDADATDGLRSYIEHLRRSAPAVLYLGPALLNRPA